MALHSGGRVRAVGAFERSRVGRLVLSVAIAMMLLAEIGTHLPAGPIARTLGPSAYRVLNLTASEQTWKVFAPNPRSVSLRLEARVTFADDSTVRWRLPEGAVIGTNLRYYRWRKWLEYVRADAEWLLWDPTARWIASLYDDRHSPVTKVELIRHFHANRVIGPQPAWQSYTYYTLDLALAGA